MCKGTPNSDSTHRDLTSKTLSQETMIPNAELVIVVSIDKNIYYSTQRKMISCGINCVVHPTPLNNITIRIHDIYHQKQYVNEPNTYNILVSRQRYSTQNFNESLDKLATSHPLQ